MFELGKEIKIMRENEQTCSPNYTEVQILVDKNIKIQFYRLHIVLGKKKNEFMCYIYRLCTFKKKQKDKNFRSNKIWRYV